MPTAISLSGGGANGDFEVGAVHFLYAHGIRPDILATTSVGSVNGLKLAEGEGTSEQGLAGLTNIWLSLNEPSDFFTEADWLVSGDHPEIRAYLRQFVRNFAVLLGPAAQGKLVAHPSLRELDRIEAAALSADLAALWNALTSAQQPDLGTLLLLSLLPSPVTVWAGIAKIQSALDSLETLVREIGGAANFFTPQPLRERAHRFLDFQKIREWHDSGKQLLMATVALNSGRLRYVTDQGDVLERNGAPAMQAHGTPPACRVQLDTVHGLEADLKDLHDQFEHGNKTGIGVRLDELRSELSEAKAALNSCLLANPPERSPIRVDPIEGMMASLTLPSFFPPISLSGESYVDGGIRAVMPTEIAALKGADRIIGVSAGRDDVDFDSSGWTIANNALRSLLSVAINEIAFRDAHPPAWPPGVTFTQIAPRVDIHTLFVLYPAFVRIRMAYGWMCAADAIHPLSDATAACRAKDIADRITVLRYGATRLEAWLGGHPVPPAMRVHSLVGSDGAPAALQAIKAEIGALVEERRRLGAALPSGRSDWDDPDRWSKSAEAHPWNRPGRISIWKMDTQSRRVGFVEHGPFAGWTPVNCHGNQMLWRHEDGRASLWQLDDAGNKTGYVEHGPFPFFTPINISAGRLLFRTLDGRVSIWRLDSRGNRVAFKEHGPFAGYVAVQLADDHLLWRKGDGQASLWKLDDQGNKASFSEFGPFAGFQPISYSAGFLLWRHDSGKISLWRLDANDRKVTFKEHGPFPGWHAIGLGDGKILWKHDDGRASLWTVNSACEKASAADYGPFAGWQPMSYSNSRMIWVLGPTP